MRLHPFVIACAAGLSLAGCGESGSQVSGDDFSTPSQPVTSDFDQNKLLESVVDDVIVPTYQQFQTELDAQRDSISNYCLALQNGNDVSVSKDQAQQDWRVAMTTWQHAELMQIGPLASNSGSLRNRIYSWPDVSACSVDQEVIVSRQDDYDISRRTNSRRGMDALEYLLFTDDLNHQCTIAGTEPDGWVALSDDQKREYRCAFAQQVVADLQTSTSSLIEQWQGDDGYGERLKNAGLPGSVYANSFEAVNEVTDALFYITEYTKDAKIGTPLGLFANDCGAEPCPDNVESRYAHHSAQNIQANLTGLLYVLQGSSDADTGVGFDDFLTDVGDPETAQRLMRDVRAAIARTEALDSSLADTLTTNADEVEALHSDVKAVTDTMKSDFINSLALELPETSAGDND